jgi:hypothetical protein
MSKFFTIDWYICHTISVYPATATSPQKKIVARLKEMSSSCTLAEKFCPALA